MGDIEVTGIGITQGSYHEPGYNCDIRSVQPKSEATPGLPVYLVEMRCSGGWRRARAPSIGPRGLGATEGEQQRHPRYCWRGWRNVSLDPSFAAAQTIGVTNMLTADVQVKRRRSADSTLLK
jgi:hypothetical protein